jgi:hypothetical protein
MQNYTPVPSPATAFQALDGLLKKSELRIVPEKRREFEKQVTQLELDLIAKLSRQTSNYCNGGWEEIQEDWVNLHNQYETLQERQQLQTPADWDEFDAAIRWMVGRGMEEELELVEQVMKNPPKVRKEGLSASESEKEIYDLIHSAAQRIRMRLNDPARILVEGEEAYRKNESMWSKEYPDEFIAIYRGVVVAHDRDQTQLAKKLTDLQREKGRFRAYVVKVGSSLVGAHGPHGSLPRLIRAKNKEL